MNSNDLLSFLQRLMGVQHPEVTYPDDEESEYNGAQAGAEISPDVSAQASQDAPQQSFDPAQLGKYEQPYNELVASGMPPEEAYAILMEQMQADQSAYSEYAPQQPQPKANFGVYGRTN